MKHPLVKSLNLAPHEEGGYYREVFKSSRSMETGRPGGRRPLCSTIYYLLTADSRTGHLHRNNSDITHFFHMGAPMKYTLISPAGELSAFTMGSNVDEGEQLQYTVPAGYWKASVLEKGDYGLISEVVVPGFDWRDMTIASMVDIENAFPHLLSKVKHLIRN
ncbi:MAG: cupin domain-containing protein [Deltaproteobacteria bacterium]|nr:cupin domain-containing protein [Deltaproteobacteria bacterium]MBI3293775.1 cupin domain-containing protein [Deltaproteobacteria bacterium]